MAKKSAGRGNARPADLASIPGIKKASEIAAPERKVELTTRPDQSEYTMSVDDAAKMLEISPATVRREADAQRLPHIRKGVGERRKYLFRPIDIERYSAGVVEYIADGVEPIPMNAIDPSDLQTNPEIEAVHADKPELFAGWTLEDWQELFSLHGTGGALTRSGVEEAAKEIGRIRDLRAKFEAVIRSDQQHANALILMVDSLYNSLKVTRKPR